MCADGTALSNQKERRGESQNCGRHCACGCRRQRNEDDPQHHGDGEHPQVNPTAQFRLYGRYDFFKATAHLAAGSLDCRFDGPAFAFFNHLCLLVLSGVSPVAFQRGGFRETSWHLSTYANVGYGSVSYLACTCPHHPVRVARPTCPHRAARVARPTYPDHPAGLLHDAGPPGQYCGTAINKSFPECLCACPRCCTAFMNAASRATSPRVICPATSASFWMATAAGPAPLVPPPLPAIAVGPIKSLNSLNGVRKSTSRSLPSGCSLLTILSAKQKNSTRF